MGMGLAGSAWKQVGMINVWARNEGPGMHRAATDPVAGGLGILGHPAL
jgi:hypothetical protein